MTGYQLTFFTQQDRRHGHHPLQQWLMELIQSMGIRGATMTAAQEGLGGHHRLHSARFFDLADQPIEITVVVTEFEQGGNYDHSDPYAPWPCRRH